MRAVLGKFMQDEEGQGLVAFAFGPLEAHTFALPSYIHTPCKELPALPAAE